MRRAAYTKKKVVETGFMLFTQLKAGASLSTIKDLFSTLDPDKVEKLNKESTKVFKKAMDKGADKLTDVTGKILKLDKPSYDVQINQLVENNLKYVKDLGNDQQKLIIKKLQAGIKDGKTYEQMSDDITKSVRGMTKARANLIARTEVTRATNVSMEKTMKANGFRTYFYLTAGDDRVSDICNKNSFGNVKGTGPMQPHLVGKGPLPVKDSHPNCRCTIVKA